MSQVAHLQYQQHNTTRSGSTSPGWEGSSLQPPPPCIKLSGIHLYAWMKRGTRDVKYLAQEHNIKSPAKAQARATQSEDKRSNHQAHSAATFSLLLQHTGNNSQIIMNKIVKKKQCQVIPFLINYMYEKEAVF